MKEPHEHGLSTAWQCYKQRQGGARRSAATACRWTNQKLLWECCELCASV